MLDRLVVAGFEMQEGHLLDAGPISPVERVGAAEIERAGDPALIAPAHHQRDAPGHSLAQLREEAPVAVGPAPLAPDRVNIEEEEGVPVLLTDLGPAQEQELAPFAPRRPPPLTVTIKLGARRG